MSDPPPRIVSLVLVTPDGTVLGRLPPFTAGTPWWMDTGPVVDHVLAEHGLVVTVLRLLDAERPSAHGGAVTYVAEVDPGPTPLPFLAPWPASLPYDPKRHPYARIGGPAADLRWADEILSSRGLARTGPARQVRTWNLSSLWTLPTIEGPVWLKVVPPFFAHEGAILERLAGGPVPAILGRDGGRLLLANVPGEDRYDAPLDERIRMIDQLVEIQAAWLGRGAELLEIGLPDWRGPALTGAIRALVDRTEPMLDDDGVRVLAAFAADLPVRLDAVAACGLADGLVHGDFHPGNVRGDGTSVTILDWGDSGVGHPLLDQPAFLAQTDDVDRDLIAAHWSAAWRGRVRGSDPDRATILLAPVAAARQAVVYQRFLDGIEVAEHPYHQADVPDWLRRTVAILERDGRPT